MFLVAMMYPSASEKHGIHGHEDHTGNEHHEENHQELSIREKFGLCRKVLGIKRVAKVLKYIGLVTLLFANFEVFICYSNEELSGIKTIFEGSMVVIVYFASTIWLVLYNSIWANKRNRLFMIAAILARIALIGFTGA